MRLQDKLLKLARKTFKDVYSVNINFSLNVQGKEYMDCFLWTEDIEVIASYAIYNTKKRTYSSLLVEAMNGLEENHRRRNEATESTT